MPQRTTYYRLTVYNSGDPRAEQWNWRLRGPNGKIIGADSEPNGYRKRVNCFRNFTTLTAVALEGHRHREKYQQATFIATRRQFETERRMTRAWKL